MAPPPSLGEQELAVLRYVADHAPVTVRDVVRGWGEPRGLARTTVLTVLERLRTKGRLVRERSEDASRWEYRPAVERSAMLQGLVQDFVERSLGGSLSPFVAYLAQAPRLTPDEATELRRLLERLEETKG